MKYYSEYPEDKNLSESYDPLVEEKKIFDLWSKKQAFEKIQQNRRQENNGILSFHNGPPFANGSPHCGHILNGIVKDIFSRYGRQKKLQVVGQFGWDCHGLAVEHEVDKKLGIKTPEDIRKIGIATYNEACRKFVQRHEAEWKNIFDRIGIWVDFTNVYSTMSREYMEAVWGVFKQLYDKGLVYRGTKVLPYSTGCFTHLSNFEAEKNWKEVTETSATISVNAVDSEVKLLICTTAPWTLIANMAICVNPSLKYVKVKLVTSGEVYVLSENRLPFLFGNSSDYVVLGEVRGKQLQGVRYQPLLSYLSGSDKTFEILADDCVRDDWGTGITALSPYFAKADYRVCLENGITPHDDLCPIDETGRFKQNISEVAGLSTKEASSVVVEILQRRGHFVQLEDIKQKRPHCWRSDVPLIYKPSSTWFIRLEGLATKLAVNNSEVEWFHCNGDNINNHFQHFGDWAVGRNRYWGTPIPIWSSPSGDEIRCIGSADELLQLTGCTNLSDLHREFVDELLVPSSIPGNPSLRRVPEVFDCWFESGVMPFVQQRSQADFIAEGLDQASGWFYTTSVLATALSLQPPSKKLVAHGLVQDLDGTKVSKRKHNHSDPVRIAEKYGADALRLYMATTPLTKGEHFTLQEDDVRQMSEKVIQPLYRIFYNLVPHLGKAGCVSYGVINQPTYVDNIFDRWILSCTESLIQFYDSELRAYRLHSVIPRIVKLIELVQDWYIPVRRTAIRKGDGTTFILYSVVYRMCIILAPFAPFFIEHIYQILHPWVGGYFKRDFVHDSALPERSNALVQLLVEVKVARWKMIIEMVRDLRTHWVIPIQYRISELYVVHPVHTFLEDNELLKETLMKLANVNQVTTTNDRCKFGATFKADLRANTLLYERMSPTERESALSSLRQLNDCQVEEVIRRESHEVEQYNIHLDDIQISYQFTKELDSKHAMTSRGDLLVVIRMNKDLNFYAEGTRLELISSIQRIRKKAKVFPSEFVTVCYSTKDRCLRHAFQKYAEDVSKSTNSDVKCMESGREVGENIAEEAVDIKGAPVSFYLFRRN